MIIHPCPTGRVDAPGLYDMSADQYHADPSPVRPSLSSSVAAVLLDRSPKHAKTLIDRRQAEDGSAEDGSARLDLGSLAHKLLLGKGADIERVDADNYRTKAAQELRDAARAAGRIPALRHQIADAEAMVDEVRPAFDSLLAGCEWRPEVVAVWQDDHGVWCRAMFDVLAIDHAKGEVIALDYKTTSQIDRDKLGRKVVDFHYEIQAALYIRGLERLYPEWAGRIKWRHLWQEIEPPYDWLPTKLDAVGREIGDRKVEHAIKTWAHCLATSRWPGLAMAGVETIEYPTYEANRFEWWEAMIGSAEIDEVRHAV